jgi:cytosine/adenosine deaminase-related metal-dependent hydrolase
MGILPMSDVPQVLTARFVAPIDRPVIRHGAVAFADGIITDVGVAKQIIATHPDASVIDIGSGVLLPGLINAHTHLELSGCSRADAPASFVDWILSLPQRAGITRGLTLEQIVPDSVRRGVEQCLKFGVTCVGDISQHSHLSRPVLRDSAIRCVSYGEVLGLAQRRHRFDELLPRALDVSCESDRLHIGLTAHAPYTVDLPCYQQCLSIVRERGLPFATHLAETPSEEQFLRDHSGPFQEMWSRLGFWSEPVETFCGSPTDFAQAIGMLEYPTLLAHVNYCTDTELDVLARGNASVVYCPRTHAYFNHPPHRWREMLSRGINVAVGTDSCASSPNLNIVEELRLLRKIAPEVPAQTVWELATIRAARAIQMEKSIGSIMRGKAADLVAFPVTSDDPFEELLHETVLPSLVYVGGMRA